MKATAISVAEPTNEKYYPHLSLSGDEIAEYLGDFDFEPGKRYSVEFEFEVDGWHKNPDGKESIELCIKSGNGAQEVGEASGPTEPVEDEPKAKEAKPKAKAAKITVKAEPVDESY